MEHFTLNSIDEEGREFLTDRHLHYPVAVCLGLASENGEIAFPYIRNGQIVRTKYRSMSDKKKMRFSSLPESQKADFKMPFWNQRIWPTSDYLILTEGELDAVAITQLGASNVASLPNGASSVASTFRNNYEYLQMFDLIYIAFDMDEAGNAAAEEARKLISPSKYRRIMFPAKDANEWVQNNPDLEKKDLDDLMRNAQRVQVDEIVNLRDLPRTFMKARTKGVSTGWKDLDRMMGGIRTKELTVVSADTGAGKTTFCVNLLCNLMEKDPGGIWINSWEMDHEVIVRKIASNVLKTRFKTEEFTPDQAAKFQVWMQNNNAFINPKRSQADLGTLHKQIEMASKVYGVKYVALDHLDYIVPNKSDRETHERIRECIEALHIMAMEFDVHIFLIAHPKQTDEATGKIHMGQIRGGASIKQYADNVILLQNMSQADTSVPDNRMKITVPKNRFFGTKGEIFLRYIKESDSYIENSEIFESIENLQTHEPHEVKW